MFFAITWSYGVRKKYNASNWTVFGSFLFTLSAIALPISNFSYVNCLWIIPVIFLLTILIPYFYVYKIPIITNIITLLSSLYASLMRIGIDKEIIKRDSEKLNKKFIEDWKQRGN